MKTTITYKPATWTLRPTPAIASAVQAGMRETGLKRQTLIFKVLDDHLEMTLEKISREQGMARQQRIFNRFTQQDQSRILHRARMVLGGCG